MHDAYRNFTAFILNFHDWHLSMYVTARYVYIIIYKIGFQL